MKRLVLLIVVIAAIPVAGWLAGNGVESHFRKQWAEEVAKQLGDRGLAALASGQLSLDRFCRESTASTEAACRTFHNVLLLKTVSIYALIAGIALVVAIFLAARFVSFNRRLLVNVFSPGMKAVLLVLFSLILVQGAIATYGAYVYEATVFRRVHFIIIGSIGLGALVGAIAMIRAGLSISRRASTSVIGKQISEEGEPQLWKFVHDIAERLGSIVPKNIVIGLEPNFYVTAAEVMVFPAARRLANETLYLSLPLMRILSRDELTGVLGHELGHFRGEDTEFSLKFYPIYAGTTQALATLKSRTFEGLRSVALLPASAVLSFFLEQFAVAERAIGRQRELEADKAGAAASNGIALATSLLKIGAFAPLWDSIRSAMVEALNEGKAYKNVSSLYLEIAVASSKPDLLDDVSSSATTHPTDTHPPTGARVEALGLSVAQLRDQALVIDPHSSSATLLSRATEIEEELTEAQHQLLIALGIVQLPQQEEEWTHDLTGIKFPKNLGPFTKGSHATHEPEFGVSVPYDLENRAKVTISLYKMGMRQIPDGSESKEVKAQFELATRDIQRYAEVGTYLFLKEGETGTITFQTKKGKHAALFKSFTYKEYEQGIEPGPALNSYLVLTGYKNVFVKIRFSCIHEDAICSEEFLQSFLDEFGTLLE